MVWGWPLRIIVTPGNQNDITVVKELTKGLTAKYLMADKGYDGRAALEAARTIGAKPVIPQRKGAKTKRGTDMFVYQARYHQKSIR